MKQMKRLEQMSNRDVVLRDCEEEMEIYIYIYIVELQIEQNGSKNRSEKKSKSVFCISNISVICMYVRNYICFSVCRSCGLSASLVDI